MLGLHSFKLYFFLSPSMMQLGAGFRIAKNKKADAADGAETSEGEEMGAQPDWGILMLNTYATSCSSGTRRATKEECEIMRSVMYRKGMATNRVLQVDTREWENHAPAGCYLYLLEWGGSAPKAVRYNGGNWKGVGQEYSRPLCVQPTSPVAGPAPMPHPAPTPPKTNGPPGMVQCGEEYQRLSGRLDGWGEISAIQGGINVADCTQCREWCDDIPECGSYECSARQKKCNLNIAAYPTPWLPSYQDFAFCQKLSRTTTTVNPWAAFQPAPAPTGGGGAGEVPPWLR